jgi:hypothetical protein
MMVLLSEKLWTTRILHEINANPLLAFSGLMSLKLATADLLSVFIS